MPHPFQCTASVKLDGKAFLLAACGPKLLSLSVNDGSIISQWTADSVGTAPVESTPNDSTNAENGERPAKKQKTTAKPAPTLTNVIKLTVSQDQQHAVAVTEDKCVRVFSIQSDGALVELSQRTMPKRPCALEILPDNDTIICGDKFGDVYSLPLLPTDESEKVASDAKAAQEAQAADAKAQAEAKEATFKPSATNLTVHTKRNLKSLEAQQKQKLFTPKKEALAFEHKLLLGHVSMLTDTTFATREVDGKTRRYIISADRDEHIRISRGAPQSHIIEGFCLGHKEFVSKVCLIPGTDLLVSGGGDDWIGIWDWPNFALKNTINIRELLAKYVVATPEEKDPHISVSGIWTVPIENQPGHSAVIVACEKIPALVVLSSADITESAAKTTVVEQQLQEKYPLDVTQVDQHTVVSIDARAGDQKRLIAFRTTVDSDSRVQLERDEAFEGKLAPFNDLAGIEEDPKTLDSLLYNVKNLKKRTGWGEPSEPEGQPQE